MLLPKHKLPPARSGSTSVRTHFSPFLISPSCSPAARYRLSVPGPRCRRRGCLWHRLFCRPSPNRKKGCDQEDCPLRPFNVLFEDSPGVKAAQISQRGRCMRKRKLLIGSTHPYLFAYLPRFQIISILDIIKPPSIEAFKEVYCDCSLTSTPFLSAKLINPI